MIEFGETLRKAREAKGLSIKDIMSKTHMMERQIECLEREDFSRFPAPIYGRGFVKLYCEATGLDPKPMIDAFMELYRKGTPPRPEAAKIVSPAPVAEPLPAPVPEKKVENPVPAPPPPSAPPPADDVFSLQSDIVEKMPPQANPFETMDEEIGAKPEKPRRFSPPRPIETKKPFKMPALPRIPRRVWRIIALAAGAGAVLYLLALGASSIFKAAKTAPADELVPAGAPDQPVRERNVDTIAPLYIDG